jgi:dienelactone hydrolase
MIKEALSTLWLLLLLTVGRPAAAQAPLDPLPGTTPLAASTNVAAEMTAGIDKFLMRELERSVGERPKFWNRDFSSAAAYEKSIQPNRERLRRMIGAVDARTAAAWPDAGTDGVFVARSEAFTVETARWPVFPGVYGEGLLLRPKAAAVARIVAIPDAGQTPEMAAGVAPGLPAERQFARRLAENGCEVLVPVLIDRRDTESGNRQLERFTNQPHREWIYRQAFELGRHIIGYEVEKVMAAVDFLQGQRPNASGQGLKIGVMGYAEGGLIAFYSAALDLRIDAALVSGYFDSRQRVWEEPIYRNVFGLLREFGDAEIASLIAPRSLIIEHSPAPAIDGPPEPGPGRAGAAPGRLSTPDYDSVETERERAQAILEGGLSKGFAPPTLICGNEGMTCGPGSDRALTTLLNSLGRPVEQVKPPGPGPASLGQPADPAARQKRQVEELQACTQKLGRECEQGRAEFFWNNAKAASPHEWDARRLRFRNLLWEEVLGRLPAPTIAANPRSRRLEWPPGGAQAESRRWTGYEVRLEVYPDVFAWGYLLVPQDLKPGERRPAVVCQHGLSSGPEDTINEDPQSQAFGYYKGFAARLAGQGFVVFAPQNPYRYGEQFRPLQRKANPLKLSLFSFIIAQHSRVLDWLATLPFVDAGRIGFYGLSYGGATALRVPAVLEGYSLSICSGNFNDWVRKNVSTDFPASYMFHGEYEMPEFDLGHSFGHAEMAALIAPRPFMVERGHADNVGLDEWVAAEYAKVRAFYEQLGIGDRTAIEFFDGGHTINAIGTFDFLHRHLGADSK